MVLAFIRNPRLKQARMTQLEIEPFDFALKIQRFDLNQGRFNRAISIFCVD